MEVVVVAVMIIMLLIVTMNCKISFSKYVNVWRVWGYDIINSLICRVGALMSRCPPTWRRIVQTDLDIQGSHTHHAPMPSSCAWTTNGGVHGETVMPNNVKRCLHKWILIAVAIEAAMLEDRMTSHEITLFILMFRKNVSWKNAKLQSYIISLILCPIFFTVLFVFY